MKKTSKKRKTKRYKTKKMKDLHDARELGALEIRTVTGQNGSASKATKSAGKNWDTNCFY